MKYSLILLFLCSIAYCGTNSLYDDRGVNSLIAENEMSSTTVRLKATSDGALYTTVSGVTITNAIFTGTVTVVNNSVADYDLLVATFSGIVSNEDNGVVSFSPAFSVSNIWAISEGNSNTIYSNKGNIIPLRKGIPIQLPLPRKMTNPVFTWTLSAGATVSIVVTGGK